MTHLLPLLAAATVGLCGVVGVVVTAARRPPAGAALGLGGGESHPQDTTPAVRDRIPSCA